MGNWNNFFLQKMGTVNNAAYPVKDSVVEWGVWCKDIPFVILDKVKEPAKRTWNDEHGDDEYIPDGGAYLQAYSMKVEFGCKKMTSQGSTSPRPVTVSDVRANVGNFLSYLRTSGMMKIYSSYTRIGRQYVRLESVDDNAKWKKDHDGFEYLVFSVTFKVNDPMTDVTLSTTPVITPTT